MGRVAYKFLEVRELLCSGDVDRLDEELVAALCIIGRVGLHRLEEYCMQGAESRGQSHVTTSRPRGDGVSYRQPRHPGQARCGRNSDERST